MHWVAFTERAGLYAHYFEALNTLFRVENALRFFVFLVLKDALGTKWEHTEVPNPVGSPSTIAAIAKRRLLQASTYGHIGYAITCPVMHLTIGELTGVMLSETHWSKFKRFFVAKKDVIELKFEEISQVRNALAHFRPISLDDVSLIGVNSRHAMERIENFINEAVGFKSIMPTNCEYPWYKGLSSLPVGERTLMLSVTRDENWVEIHLPFETPVTWTSMGDKWQMGSAIALRSPAIFAASPVLQEHVACAMESVNFAPASPELPTKARKGIRLLVSRGRLDAHHAEIEAAIRDVVRQFYEEVSQIQQDNFIKGKVAKLINPFAHLQDDGLWNVALREELSDKVGENDPPEYLGDYYPYGNTNFVSHTHEFPWMSMPICPR